MIINRDNVGWYEAPLPPRRHKCQTQTIGLTGTAIMNRCACGAFRSYPGPWTGINSRRREPKKVSLWQRILRRMGR